MSGCAICVYDLYEESLAEKRTYNDGNKWVLKLLIV